MSVVDKLETNAAGWYKNAPHMPLNAQKWLAENVWWLAVISVVASVIGIFVMVGAIITYTSLMGAVAVFYTGTQVYSAGWLLSTLVSLAFLVATTILTAMAISPLRTQRKKGWKLLFLTVLVSVASVVVGAVLSMNVGVFISDILFGAIATAVGAYFLFEIRSHFVVRSTNSGSPTFKPPVSA